MLLYKSMIWSHLEYAQTVWSPYKQKHIEALEAVQRTATKILPCMKKLSYSDRLKKLALPILTYQRLTEDIIETYKIVHWIYDLTAAPVLEFHNYIATRGHQYKLSRKHVILTLEWNTQWCSRDLCFRDRAEPRLFKNVSRGVSSRDLSIKNRAVLVAGVFSCRDIANLPATISRYHMH